MQEILVIGITAGVLVLILIITEYLKLDILGIGRRRARREFPRAAEELGFAEKKGRYRGRYDEFYFVIEPEENATIFLGMPEIAGVEISTNRGVRNFDTGNRDFDRIYRKRVAPERFRNALIKNPNMINDMVKFAKRWHGKYRYIQLTHDGIYVSLRYGFGHYIPASVLRHIVPEMVNLARSVQNATYK